MGSPWTKTCSAGDCLILGYFFFWYLLQTWKTERSTWRRNELRLIAGFGIGIWWLFSQAHSATAVTSFYRGSTDRCVCRHPFNKQESDRDIPLSRRWLSLSWQKRHLGFRGICRRVWGGVPSCRGEDPSGRPSWACIPTRFLGRDLKASGWETDQRRWKAFSIISQTRLIMAIWKPI